MPSSFSFHPQAKKIWKKDRIPSVALLSAEILQGNQFALARTITLLESANERQSNIAKKVLSNLCPHSGKSIRIGITGVPGVGKSTFIEALGIYLIQHLGKKVAVLAIDPSSSITKGSILGDKTRMNVLSSNKSAFIRPSSNRAIFGGVAAKTSESIVLCEACGFDVILVETVGVGQSEHEVFNIVDFFLLLMVANTGDELQGIKRGIVEMAHAILINKADGQQRNESKNAMAKFGNALELMLPINKNWKSTIGLCSATENTGIVEFWKTVELFVKTVGLEGIKENRKNQELTRFEVLTKDLILKQFWAYQENRKLYEKLHKKLQNGEFSAVQALSMFNYKINM